MFHPRTSDVVTADDKVAIWLSTIAQHIFIITLGLSPLLFIPSSLVPLGYSKIVLVMAGVLAALIFQSLAMLRTGSITLRLPLPLLALMSVLTVMLISALLSGDIRDGIVGNTFGVQTVSFMALLVLISFSGLMLNSSKIAVIRFYLLFMTSSLVLGAFHLVRFVTGPEVLSFGLLNSAVSTPLGGWNDLALYFGVVLLMSLVAIEQLPLTKIARAILTVLTIMSLVILAVVNFIFVWIVLGVVSLVVLMYSLTKHRFSGGQMSLEGVGTSSVVSIILSTVVFVASTMFVIGSGTFGPMIGNLTGVDYLEVRPSLTATFDLARQVVNDSPVLGIGPNKFIDAWRLYKDTSINQTIFWNTNFEAGNGLITTSLVTVGVLGFASWVIFLLLLLWSGLKSTFKPQNHDRFWRFVIISSFVSSIYLWGMAVVYVPAAGTLILAAACTSMFIAAYTVTMPTRSWTFSVLNNRSLGLVMVAASMLTIFGSIGSMYYVSQHYLAIHNFNRAVSQIEPGDSIDQLMTAVASSYQLSASDEFARQVAGYNLSQLNTLIATEANDQTAELFRSAAANGVNAAQVAVQNDRSEPLNWQVLGQVYSLLTVAGVEGAYDRAEEAFHQAQAFDPQNPLIVLLVAQAASRNGDNEQARQLVEQAINLKSNYVDALLFLTELDVADGKVADAIKHTESVITLEPNNPARRYQLGILKSANDDIAGAVTAFEQAVALDTNFSNARYFLAIGYAQLKRPADAQAQLEAVLELNPGNELIMSLLKQLKETGTINVTSAPTESVSDNEVTVGEDGQISSNEAPDTPLVSTVNGTPSEETAASNATSSDSSN